MNEFDDRELGDALRRRAGAVTDGFGIEAARSAVVTRAAHVRRRRAAVAGGAVMAGLIAVAVLVIGPGTDSVVTTPADSSDGSAPAPVETPVDATAVRATDPERTNPDGDAIDTTPPANTSPSPATTVPSVIPPTGTASSTSAPSTTTAPETTVVAPPTTPPPTPPATATTPPPGPGTTTDTYSSAGGSITVQWDGTALDFQYATGSAGFDVEVEDDRPDRIRVRFRGSGGDVRIELRVEDGRVVRVE